MTTTNPTRSPLGTPTGTFKSSEGDRDSGSRTGVTVAIAVSVGSVALLVGVCGFAFARLYRKTPVRPTGIVRQPELVLGGVVPYLVHPHDDATRRVVSCKIPAEKGDDPPPYLTVRDGPPNTVTKI